MINMERISKQEKGEYSREEIPLETERTHKREWTLEILKGNFHLILLVV